MTNEKYIDLEFAKLDMERIKRRGYSETVFCESKTNEQLAKIFETFELSGLNVLGTRASELQYDFLKEKFQKIQYNNKARVLTLIQKPVKKVGLISVCTAGTGDIAVAEEVCAVAEFFGSYVKKFYDIGVAGVHRVFDNINEIKKANVVVVVAGMEGTLGGIITGLVDVPVIAVPTSVGYGSSMNGISALLTMLNSCAEGMTVVNIDNGFNAGYSACQINRKIAGDK